MQVPQYVHLSVPTEVRIERLRKAKLELDVKTFGSEWKNLQEEIHIRCGILDDELIPYSTILEDALDNTRELCENIDADNKDIRDAKLQLEKASWNYASQHKRIKDLKNQYMVELQKVLSSV